MTREEWDAYIKELRVQLMNAQAEAKPSKPEPIGDFDCDDETEIVRRPMFTYDETETRYQARRFES